MNIVYCIESSSEYLSSKMQDFNIPVIGGDLTYCYESLQKHCWLELIQTENKNDKSNEPELVLGFATNMVDYTVRGTDDGIKGCPFFGNKIELDKVGYDT